MKNEGKKEGISTKILKIFKNIFKKNKVHALPEKVEEEKNDNYKINDETIKHEGQINTNKSKEEYLQMYKDIKDKKIDPNTLTEQELKVFIQLAKQELNFLNKKIDEEITKGNMYQREIDFYSKKLSEMSN